MKLNMLRASMLALALVTSAATIAPVFADETPVQIRDRLEKLRQEKFAELRQAGRATPEEFRKIDLEIRDLARTAETTRSKALGSLSEGAGGVDIGQGGAGTAPTEGRGVMGDIDTKSLTPRDFDKVLKAASDRNYTITHEGDAFTIKELDVTVHRMPARNMAYGSSEQVGGSGYQAEVNRGFNQETATGVDPVTLKPTDPALGVSDNIKKAAHTLDTPAGSISGDEMQKLGKMTQRNLDAISNMSPDTAPDPGLRQQAQALKDGFSPEAAGIVRPNATPAERTADIEAFQNRCRDVTHEAVRTADTHVNQQMDSLAGEARKANEALEVARTSGDQPSITAAAERAKQAEQAVIDYQMTQSSAREAAVMKDAGAAKVMAEARGINTAGESPSQVREAVVATERQAVTSTIETPTKVPSTGGAKPTEVPAGAASTEAAGAEVAAGRGSAVIKGIGGALAVYGIVKGVQKGAEEAGKEAAENGDSTATSMAKTVGYSAWHGLGFGAAKEIGTKAGEESAKQWLEDVKAGRVDPNSAMSRYWAQARAVGWGLAEFTGLQAVKDATVEGAGYVKDRYDQYKAEKGEQTQKLADAQRNADRAATAALKAEKDKAAADKTGGDQTGSDKSAGDKAAGDKTTNDKSADQTGADKTAAEKEAADKAAADKAAIAKIVAKHLAEKKAAEKAAAEKAAAEKAAAEKAAAEKAAAAQAAADKAAADQDAADQAAGEEAGGNLENQTVEAGTMTDKNGSTKLVYIKDKAGNILGGYYIHYDKTGKEIGRETFSGDSPPDSAGNATLGGTYRGRISGGSSGSMSLTVSGSQVNGHISGVHQGDSISADFSGSLDASGNFSASANGLLTTTALGNKPMSFKFSGTVRGRVDGKSGAGSWSGQNQWGKSSGTWRAAK